MFQDYLLDDDGDLLIQNGDFVVGASDDQHVADILQSFQGEWKQFPLLGVGLLRFLNSNNPNEAINTIKEQLQSDGYNVSNVKTTIDKTGNLIVTFPDNGIVRNA